MQKCANLADLEKCWKTHILFYCKNSFNWFRYSRERARQKFEKFYKMLRKFANFSTSEPKETAIRCSASCRCYSSTSRWVTSRLAAGMKPGVSSSFTRYVSSFWCPRLENSSPHPQTHNHPFPIIQKIRMNTCKTRLCSQFSLQGRGTIPWSCAQLRSYPWSRKPIMRIASMQHIAPVP